jgi:hypothetical protein
MSNQLVWEITKGWNSFVRKATKGVWFSAEPGNLYNKHSYKYSGARGNRGGGDVQPAEPGGGPARGPRGSWESGRAPGCWWGRTLAQPIATRSSCRLCQHQDRGRAG